MELHDVALAREPQRAGVHRQPAHDKDVAAPFPQLLVVRAAVHQVALRGQHVVRPRLFKVDERPLTAAEREMLDARQREELVLVVHGYTSLWTVTPSGTAASSTTIGS